MFRQIDGKMKITKFANNCKYYYEEWYGNYEAKMIENLKRIKSYISFFTSIMSNGCTVPFKLYVYFSYYNRIHAVINAYLIYYNVHSIPVIYII